MKKMNIIITSSSFSSNILRRCSGIISLSPMMEEKVHNYNYNNHKTKLSDYIPAFSLKEYCTCFNEIQQEGAFALAADISY